MLQRMVSALFCFKIFIVEQLDLTFLFCFGMKAEDMEFSVISRCSSTTINTTLIEQPHCNHFQDEVSSLDTALLLSNLLQHKTDRYVFPGSFPDHNGLMIFSGHCMFCRDRKAKEISSKANHKINPRRQHLKPHLPLYRHIPRFLPWLVLLCRAQLIHNRNPLSSWSSRFQAVCLFLIGGTSFGSSTAFCCSFKMRHYS